MAREPSVARELIVVRLRAAGCVFAEDEADLLLATAGDGTSLAAMVGLRVDGLPLQHVLGWAEFCGIRVTVAPGVFVPRVRTELLVREAAALVRAAALVHQAAALAAGHLIPGAVVLDLCCGAGAIGAAVAATAGPIDLYAADIDPAAVACARVNLEPLGAKVFQGDLFEPLPGYLRGKVDVLVTNVPYVPTAELDLLPPEARCYEPRTALDGGADGLDVLRRVAVPAPEWLAGSGHLLVETSQRQAPVAVGVLESAGFTARVAYDEDLDATVVIGTARR